MEVTKGELNLELFHEHAQKFSPQVRLSRMNFPKLPLWPHNWETIRPKATVSIRERF